MKKLFVCLIGALWFLGAGVASAASPWDGPPGTPGTPGHFGEVGPAGPAGMDGTNGVDGKDGVNGTNGTDGATGATGPAGTNGVDGKDGLNGTNGATGATGATGKDAVVSRDYYEHDKYKGGVAGAVAIAQIDHAKNGGMMLGAGIASFEGEEALAIGGGKSWKLNGEILDEVVLGAAGFISEDTEGVGASMSFHFK